MTTTTTNPTAPASAGTGIPRLSGDIRHLIPKLGLRNYWYPAITDRAVGSRKPVKVSLIGPDRILQRFDYAASRAVYPRIDGFTADVVAIQRRMIGEVVAAGCRYVQIDAPGYTAYVDQPSLALRATPAGKPASSRTREDG